MKGPFGRGPTTPNLGGRSNDHHGDEPRITKSWDDPPSTWLSQNTNPKYLGTHDFWAVRSTWGHEICFTKPKKNVRLENSGKSIEICIKLLGMPRFMGPRNDPCINWLLIYGAENTIEPPRSRRFLLLAPLSYHQ